MHSWNTLKWWSWIGIKSTDKCKQQSEHCELNKKHTKQKENKWNKITNEKCMNGFKDKKEKLFKNLNYKWISL